MTQPDDDQGALLATRRSLLYLLSLSAVTLALASWTAGPAALALAGWAVVLAAATIGGERLAPVFEPIDDDRRARIRVFSVIVYAGLVGAAFWKAVASSTSPLAPGLVQVLGALQPAFHVFVGLSRGSAPVVTNALVLYLLACLGGGPAAVVAALAAVALPGTFLVFDHYCRTLATYSAGPGRRLSLAWRDVGFTVLPAALGAALLLGAMASPAVARRGLAVGGDAAAPAVDWRILRSVMIVWIAGTSAVYVVGRFMRRRPAEEAADLEVIEPLRGPVERISPSEERPRSASYPGWRGRVVQAYLRFRREAVRLGTAWPPGGTPGEFADAVGEPAARVASLTEAFHRARYGPTGPDEQEALAAEAESVEIVGELRRRRSDPPPAGRPGGGAR